MKITLCQLNYIVGDLKGNEQKIIAAIQKAKDEKSDLVVFSELSISGYPPKDLLEYPSFTKRSDAVLEQLKKHSKDICIIVGSPIYKVKAGKNLHNSAIVILDGEIVKQYNKWLLPTYDVFDEYRYFEKGNSSPLFKYKGKNIAITICEDIWDEEFDKLYPNAPLDSIKEHIDVIVNLSASPFNYTHFEKRIDVITKNVLKYKAPIVYVNQTGANTELIFDGGSMVMNKKGEINILLPFFESCIKTVSLSQLNSCIDKNPVSNKNYKNKSIHDALIFGIKEYFNKLGLKKAVLGLSGGIDSAMVCYLAVKALGKENVLSVLLPSQYSSNHSINDSIALCENLETPYKIVKINEIVQNINGVLAPFFKGEKEDVTEENIQARTRGLLLMAFSNKFGQILLNTTNKSEAAVGYGTLYGDMCGGISVLGDVYKTELYDIAKWINLKKEIIPKNIINKPPSAELRPDQKDSDSLPDYPILDGILYAYIEEKKGEKEIAEMGYELEVVQKVLKLVNRSEFKRFQMAPILRVSPKAFGFSRKIPIVGMY